MFVLISAAVVALASAPAVATSPAPICRSLNIQIEADQQDLADVDADGIADDSAPRATMRADRQIAKYEEIRANIDLMAAHHCTPYPHIISSQRYFAPATQCRLDMLNNARDGKSDVPDTCKRENWKPAGE